MNLLNLQNISKIDNSQTILKNFSVTINTADQVGIKLSHFRSQALLNILTHRSEISGGKLFLNTEKIFVDEISDGLYENMSVSTYIRFFAKLADYHSSLDEVIGQFSLKDVWKKTIKTLDHDQRKRISLFRIFLFSPQIIVIEEPLSDLSDAGIEFYLKTLSFLHQNSIALVFLSNYVEDLLLVSDDIYRYNASNGLEKTDLISDDGSNSTSVSNDQLPNNVLKLSSKLDDKTIFFSPNEIDFIESINGVSNLSVDGEYFPTELSLNELESKLANFGFFRNHRSYLVNLQRVSEMISYSRNSYTLILKTDNRDKLPLSRNKMSQMKELIGI